MRQIKLTRDNLSYKIFSQEDICPEYINWLNDKNHMKFSRNALQEHSVDSAMQYLESFRDSKNQFLAIYQDESLVGTATLYFTPDENSCDIGILIGSNHAGKGLGLICFQSLIDIAISDYQVTKFTAGTHMDNLRMLSIFQKLGLKEITGNSLKHSRDLRYFEGYPPIMTE